MNIYTEGDTVIHVVYGIGTVRKISITSSGELVGVEFRDRHPALHNGNGIFVGKEQSCWFFREDNGHLSINPTPPKQTGFAKFVIRIEEVLIGDKVGIST